MKKYLLSIICTLLPIFASAQEPYAVMIDGNTAIEFRYDNEKAARGGMDIGPFSKAEDRPWNTYAEGIYSVIFDESFANCTSITSTDYWFFGCRNLDYIGGLEYLNTTNITGMGSMFWFCSSLTSLDLSNFNTASVTDMGMMFYGCSSLTSLNVNNFNTTNVETMYLMFASCSSLTSLDVSNFNTSNVEKMSSMFEGCSGLTSLDLSNFNTSNVTDMKAMFQACSGLTTIYVGEGWSTSSVTSSSAMFEGSTKLVGESGTTYDSSHTDAEYARVDMASSPGYFTYKNGGGSGEEAQYWMELQSMLQYAQDVQSRAQGHPNVEPWMQEELAMMIERGSNMYDEHTAEEEEVRHMIEELSWICWEIEEAMNRQPEPSGEAEPYAVLSDNNTVLTFYYDNEKSARGGMSVGPFVYGDTFTPDMEDGAQLEYSVIWGVDSRSIQHVIFDDSFAGCSSITSTAYWFYMFNNLTTITGINNFNTTNVIDMSYMFDGCSRLSSLDLSNFVTDNVTDMSAMFAGCTSLENLFISNFNTARVTKMNWMFLATPLSSLDLSNFNTSNVTEMHQMFSGCTSLRNLNISSFDTSNVLLMSMMFAGCSMDIIDISNFNTSKVELMYEMFRDCPNLKTIYVGSGWNTSNVQRGNDMFIYDTNLVGGRGTQFSPDHIDIEYAHIDGGPNNPGYLTDRNAEPSESEAYFDGLTAWVYGDATLDDAFAEVGRESAVQTIAAIVWEGTGALTAEQMQGITNPNLLVYVTEASKAPAGVQNVIVNGTAAQIVLTDASGNNNFFCPEPFTAQSISYTRNFSQTTEIGVSRGWETIALPFNVQSISHGSHGALVPFGGGNGGYPFWLHQLQDNGLTPVTAMEANTPYLICMPNNTVYPSAYNQAGSVTFASSNVTVPRTEPREAFGANVILMPAFQNQAAGPDIFTLNVGAARDSYAEGSVFISNYSDVRPFQAYVHHSNQARGTDDIQFIPLTSIGGGDDTTAIMEIIQPAANGTGDWYSLDGRKLSSKPTQKGIYIQNGKKIVIK